jgi:hypothetical protein
LPRNAIRDSLLKHPSAFVPIAMSLTALVLVAGHILLFGVEREADEGTGAHLWQLLMGGQLPLIVFFALKWLPRTPSAALRVLALQAVGALGACAPVYWFNL